MRIHGRHWLSLAALLLLAAGCQAPPKDRPLTSEVPEPPAFAPPPDSCLAEGVRFALGLRVTAALLEEMRQRSGAKFARTVLATDPPDPALDPTRLNVRVEPSGRIVGASCQ
ncbi:MULTISPECIES: hypothetical protein [Variovorax]|uniref:hypothetical protein n=1 Tax=Variovorax paradoxus TaxID=34073 RepID=UPI0019331643|nr:hypothetical protein INQ48_16470 [Variovorax paradoxus]